MNDHFNDIHERARAHTRTRGSGSLEPSTANVSDVFPSEKQNNKNIVEHTSANGSVERERERARAVAMLRDRYVDDAENVAALVDPQAVIGACVWWDRKPGANTGLLVWKIRQGGVSDTAPASKRTQLRDVFDRYVLAHPVGSRLCSHAALAARRWPDEREDCTGSLMVAVAAYPVLEMVCGVCGFDAALTPRAMKEAI